jgi:hypothetical protein
MEVVLVLFAPSFHSENLRNLCNLPPAISASLRLWSK